MKSRVIISVVILICLNLTASWGGSYSTYEAVNLIEKEYIENKLSLDQKCLYTIYALKNQEELPQRFKVIKEEELKCGTPLILEVKSNWNNLSQETRDKINQLLARPTTELSYHTPHFVIHYDTSFSSGGYPVYQPTVDVDPADGVPDYVNRVAEYM